MTLIRSGCDGAMPVRVGFGPISTKICAPNSCAAFTSSANRTARRACSRQYWASSVAPGPSSLPVRFAASAILSGRCSTLAANCSNSSRIGSISGEWNACETFNGATRMSRAASASLTRSTASRRPEIVMFSGALMPATSTSASPSTAASTTLERREDRGHRTLAAGQRCMSRPRCRDQPHTVLERERAGDHGRDVLTDAVTEDDVGHRRPSRRQSSTSAYSSANSGGLRVAGLGEHVRLALGREQQRSQRLVEVRRRSGRRPGRGPSWNVGCVS